MRQTTIYHASHRGNHTLEAATLHGVKVTFASIVAPILYLSIMAQARWTLVGSSYYLHRSIIFDSKIPLPLRMN